jgi:hypothetical protein
MLKLASMILAAILLVCGAALPVQADDWAAKESAAGKELYIPEVKLVSPDMVSGDAAQALRRYAEGRNDAVLNQKISYIKDVASGRFDIDLQN